MVSNQIRPLKKAYLPPACPKQAYRIVALKRRENHFRSKRSRSNVLHKYASARRFLARLAPGTFLTGLGTGVFNTLLRIRRAHAESTELLPEI